MVESLISIVDDNDAVIGAATKAEAWEKGLRHRIAHIMVEDTAGRLLLQRRSVEVKLFPDRWTASVSGHVDAGEDYEDAAQREAGEELGMPGPLPLTQVGKFYYSGEFEGRQLKRFNMVYRMVLESEGISLELQDSEVAETAWRTSDEAKQLVQERPEDFTPVFAMILERFY